MEMFMKFAPRNNNGFSVFSWIDFLQSIFKCFVYMPTKIQRKYKKLGAMNNMYEWMDIDWCSST